MGFFDMPPWVCWRALVSLCRQWNMPCVAPLLLCRWLWCPHVALQMLTHGWYMAPVALQMLMRVSVLPYRCWHMPLGSLQLLTHVPVLCFRYLDTNRCVTIKMCWHIAMYITLSDKSAAIPSLSTCCLTGELTHTIALLYMWADTHPCYLTGVLTYIPCCLTGGGQVHPSAVTGVCGPAGHVVPPSVTDPAPGHQEKQPSLQDRHRKHRDWCVTAAVLCSHCHLLWCWRCAGGGRQHHDGQSYLWPQPAADGMWCPAGAGVHRYVSIILGILSITPSSSSSPLLSPPTFPPLTITPPSPTDSTIF